MSTGWVWDTRFAFHDTGYGALFVPAGAPPVQPGLPFAENPLTKTRFRDLVEATPALIGALTPLAARRITDAELGGCMPRTTWSDCARSPRRAEETLPK